MAGAEQYEIEIKSLLGDHQAAHDFRNRIAAEYPGVGASARETQLNHYFEGGDIAALADRLSARFSPEERDTLETIAARGTGISIRTRQTTDEKGSVVRLVVKASLGDDSSANGVVRAELEVVMPDLTLDGLDKEILAAGFIYQAKWSRAREVYELPDVTVCLDRNAGYGYLAEFERVAESQDAIEECQVAIREAMSRLGATELPQDRLERMFAHYNSHWPEYYGTDKVFVIE